MTCGDHKQNHNEPVAAHCRDSLPPVDKGGYVFGSDWSSLSALNTVCLSVCLWTTLLQKVMTAMIGMKFYGRVLRSLQVNELIKFCW